MNARNVATALAAWCGADDVNAAKLPLFYKEHASYKEHVQGAKAPGHAKGVSRSSGFTDMTSSDLAYGWQGVVHQRAG